MAWTSPMTAVAGTPFTAAQFNTHVRDNLNMTSPAVATTAGRIIVTNGPNSLAERTPTVNYLGTLQTTNSGSYTDLGTLGPTVTVTTGIRALVIIGARISNNTIGQGGRMACEVSGATTMGASDINSFLAESGNANDEYKGSWVTIYEGINAGSNTFRGKYRLVGNGIASFSNRLVAVVPF
jgi:hypothetical protein